MREPLLERLQAEPGIKLTVLAAPAGSGKSTLLGAWRDVEEATRPVAWVTLDDGDNDPVVLWSYVLAALQEAMPDFVITAMPEVVGASRIPDLLLPELVNELTRRGEIGIVLDDFHRLSDGPARESIEWFIDRAPTSCRILIATRTEPALPLAALRAHAALLELRGADLAFSRNEADQLLNGQLDLGLAPDKIDGLVARTEGWPAGLYLAALSLQAAEDRDAMASRFGVESRTVVDFFLDEVLEAHEPAMQRLMLCSSILDRLSGALCDALLEAEGSGEMLETLAGANLFLIPLDERGRWYRLHHLFAQLLRAELEHREPGLAPELHLRASAWYSANGEIDEAVEHALSAGAFTTASDLIAANWFVYADQERQATVFAWLERFPRDQLRTDSHLLLVSAWMHGLAGSRAAAREAVGVLEGLEDLQAGPLPDGFSSAEASLAALTGTLPWIDIGVRLASVRRAAELEGPRSPWRPTICFLGGLHSYLSDELDAAESWLAEASELVGSGGHGLSVQSFLGALTIRSLVAGEQGRVEDQARLALDAASHAREHGFEETDAFHLIAVAAATDAQGDHARALTAFEQAMAVFERDDYPLLFADGLLRYAQALQAAGSPEAAVQMIDRAKNLMSGYADPGQLLLRRLAQLDRPPRAPRKTDGTALSRRELVVLRMLSGSLSERDIGRELYLSQNTIHSHTRAIYRKLGVSSRSAALEHARERGLI